MSIKDLLNKDISFSMIESDKIYSSYKEQGIDIELITKFLICFGRFENGLKRTGYAKSTTSGRIGIKHLDFVKEQCNKNLKVNCEYEVNYLINNPPKKQVTEDQNLKWVEEHYDADTEIEQVTKIIRAVRNNLFHGGKYNTGYEKDTARDTKLIQCSLRLLDEIVKNSKLSEYYEVS